MHQSLPSGSRSGRRLFPRSSVSTRNYRSMSQFDKLYLERRQSKLKACPLWTHPSCGDAAAAAPKQLGIRRRTGQHDIMIHESHLVIAPVSFLLPFSQLLHAFPNQSAPLLGCWNSP
ncbi:unnamed protein product [Arctogadus glacialis]